MKKMLFVIISTNVQVKNPHLPTAYNMISEDSHVCDHHADCIDLDGKYDCKCHIGYAGNGFECINIDECVTSTFLCPADSGEILMKSESNQAFDDFNILEWIKTERLCTKVKNDI